MKLDPIEIAAENSSSLFGRVAATWLAAGAGLVLAGMVDGGGDALAFFGILLFLPLFLFGLAVGSGWWILLALPSLGLLAWHAWMYIRGHALAKDLLPIGLLSFLICVRPRGSEWLMELVLAGIAVWILIQFYRQKN